ncbi:cupin domain-containing protein [Psychroserpens sp.]|uniref:cupin domain-containing protein n=1 Tax=Psychroserpens sp. TaxID=2020870 RepID=UPI00385E1A6B
MAYTINDTINLTTYDGLNARKILDVNVHEILHISLEKNTIFPKHTSPTDASLLVLEGTISFFIDDLEYELTKHQIFNFPKDKVHWVEATENSKFLLLR